MCRARLGMLCIFQVLPLFNAISILLHNCTTKIVKNTSKRESKIAHNHVTCYYGLCGDCLELNVNIQHTFIYNEMNFTYTKFNAPTTNLSRHTTIHKPTKNVNIQLIILTFESQRKMLSYRFFFLFWFL